MSLNITNITELTASEKAGPPATFVNMGLLEQSNCHNYKLSGTSDCGDLAELALYLEINAFDLNQYKKTDKTIELSPGKELRTWQSIDPGISFILFGDELLFSQLQIISAHQTIKFLNIATDQEEEVLSIDIAPTNDGTVIQLKVTLFFKDADTVTSLCCGSYYENAPFNECDGEGETGDPNNDNACADYTASIVLTSGPDVLTASTTGGGDGVETFRWYKDGVFFGTGASINPIVAGVYRVDAKKGNCADSESFTYSTECESFVVTVTEIPQDDGTSIFIAEPNLISTFQWQEFIDGEWTDVVGETNISFEPDHTGTFRVVATSGSCEANSDEFDYEAPGVCDGLFTITLENESGTLTVTIVDYAGDGTPSYQWFLDTGSGPELQDWTGSTVGAPLAPGYYTVLVTIDGCTQTANLLVQCDFESDDVPCGDENWFQSFDGPGDAFNVTNFSLVDPTLVTPIEIGATYLVIKNGQTMIYSDSPTLQLEYGIDYANQEIETAPSFSLEAGDIITITKLRWIRL